MEENRFAYRERYSFQLDSIAFLISEAVRPTARNYSLSLITYLIYPISSYIQLRLSSNIKLADSESFGIEKGYGKLAVDWMNEEAKKMNWKFEARLYGYEITTKNFGQFEMYSWIGDPKAARDLIIRGSKRFKIKVIEGGYKTRLMILKLARNEYGIVRRGDRTIGQIEFTSTRLTASKWAVSKEERK